jgi:hypothetical protein
MLITRSLHPSDLWPGIKLRFGNDYKAWAPIYRQIFDVQTSDKAYEQSVELTGFGMAPTKSEGASIYYDADAEGPKNTFTHVTYGLGCIASEEEIADNLYEDVMTRRSKGLRQSLMWTKETVHANVLNRAFNNAYVGADGVQLVSDSHPTASGLQSNLITASDLSESALEDMFKRLWSTKNARGMPIVLRGTKLVVHPSELFNAERILKSAMRVGTANNDTNAIRSLGMAPEVIANPYLTDEDAFFLISDVEDGLISFQRKAPDLEKKDDFDTGNAKAKAWERYSCGWGDWRSVVGSPGA